MEGEREREKEREGEGGIEGKRERERARERTAYLHPRTNAYCLFPEDIKNYSSPQLSASLMPRR